MPKILHTNRYTGTPWEILQSVVPDGFEVKTLDEPTYECLLRECGDADYLLVSGRLPIDERLLSVAKRLKMIQRTGVGTEMLDLQAISRHNIPVYVNRGVNARSVAEHTMALMLAALKNIPQIDQQVKQGVWKKQQTGITCHELYGKQVGLIGMGAIGRQVAEYLKVFGAQTLYYDVRRADTMTEESLGLHYVSAIDELLPQIDILSLHCPLTDSNRNLISARELTLLPKGAIIINTARGKLIDPTALYDALTSKHLRTAALDVHYEEPLPTEYPLAKLNNIILSPHIAGLTYEAFHSMMHEAVENIRLFDSGHLSAIDAKLLIG